MQVVQVEEVRVLDHFLVEELRVKPVVTPVQEPHVVVVAVVEQVQDICKVDKRVVPVL
jgi:hypothetical protein